MAIYAIGDVQGCFDELQALLDELRFDSAADRLLFTGDLVNRGPKSLETLRFVRSLGDAAVTVLGNHDLHLLAVALGSENPKRKDTLAEILGAPDREDLLTWLRHRPLLHVELGFYLIHAGLPPDWCAAEAADHAGEVERALRDDSYREFFAHLYGDLPDRWSVKLNGWGRLRFITNCLTRMRYCSADGRVEFKEKGRPGSQPRSLLPWFSVPGRRSAGAKILFGHWSTLGFHAQQGVWCLDTGCLWGGELTALRLDSEPLQRFAVRGLKAAYQKPASPRRIG